jgi:hypothetical protein
MRSALILLALPLVACAAKPTPTGDQLIPADATLLVGADISGITSSEMFGLFKPMLAEGVDQMTWIDMVRDCGVDPAASRLSLIFGTDGVDDGAIVFTGDGIGDETKLRCVSDKLAEKAGGTQPFAIHDRTNAQPSVAHDTVATIVDARTVVMTTRNWSAPVHDLILGKGQAAMAGPAKDMFARADRTAHAWFAGKIPGVLAARSRLAWGSEPKEFYGLVDLRAGLRISVDMGFGGPEGAASIRQKVEEAGPSIRMIAPMLGLAQKSADTIQLVMKGDEAHFEMAISVTDALALSKKMAGEQAPQDPQPDLQRNPPPS